MLFQPPLTRLNGTIRIWVKGNIAKEVSKLKQQPGQDIMVAGSNRLVHSLMQHDLVDEYRLLVYPVVLGSGKRLFGEADKATLRLMETRMFSSGVVLLRYQPNSKQI